MKLCTKSCQCITGSF